MLKIICVLLLASLGAAAQVAPPNGLLTDLLAYPDMQVLHGYPAQGAGKTVSVKIANRQPAFSWVLPDFSRQYAYRLVVAGEDTMWDSHKVESDRSTAIIYNGQPLQPGKEYSWKVKVWNDKGEESEFSKPVLFYTADVLTDYATARYPLVKTDQQPVQLTQSGDIYRADFGKAAFGQLRLQMKTDRDGDTVLVRLGEAILPDGNINREPGGTIRYQQYKIVLRAGLHTYQVLIRQDARNTGPQAILMPDYIGEVLPFRYCEVEGYTEPLQLTRAMVHYPFNDEAATFESADTILNAVWEICKYSIKATSFAGIYVDGDRERIPYEADAYINQLGHYATDREFSLARHSHEFLLHHATWPTEWILQSVLMAWYDYLYTGDLRSIRFYYNDLKAKLLMPLAGDSALISTRTGKQSPELLQAIHFSGNELRDIVDWPHTGILGLGKSEGGETDGFVFTNYNAVVNAYYYKALRDMQAMATVIGNNSDAQLFRRQADRVLKSFQQLFWDKQQRVFRDGIGTDHASLHTNMFALAFGLVPEKDKATVMSFIRSRGMACSVYGSQFLMDAVYDAGDGAYGLQLLRSQDERSWYNMIRAGSTITMEAWDNKYKPNQDWNHAWGAVPANIIPRKLMGIEPLTPGWGSFLIRPQIGDLPWARIKLPTIKGDIQVAYEQSDSAFLMTVTVPGNTSAKVVLPFKGSILLDGRPVKTLPDLKSGKYKIQVTK